MAPDLPATETYQRIDVQLASTSDRSIALRMVSLLHRRGMPISFLYLGNGDMGAQSSRQEAPDRFTAVFYSSDQRARLIAADFEGLVDVSDVRLTRGGNREC